MVKNLPAVQETQVQFLSQEDPLEKGMATQSSILAWRIPWTEEPGGLQSTGSQRVGHGLGTKLPPPQSFLVEKLLIEPRLCPKVHTLSTTTFWAGLELGKIHISGC